MAEVYGVGYFTVTVCGEDDTAVVTTRDDGTFCAVRENDENGSVAVSDYAEARELFGAAFDAAFDVARADWREKMATDGRDDR